MTSARNGFVQTAELTRGLLHVCRLDCRILKDESLPVWPSAEELAEEAASADAYKAEELSRESQSEVRRCSGVSSVQQRCFLCAMRCPVVTQRTLRQDPQVRDAYQFFLEMDKDGDGGLNEEEFMNALRQQSSDPTAWDNEDLSEIKQFFHEKELRGQPIMTWEVAFTHPLALRCSALTHAALGPGVEDAVRCRPGS